LIVRARYGGSGFLEHRRRHPTKTPCQSTHRRSLACSKSNAKAVGILKDLRTLALHKQRLQEFLRRAEGIRTKYSRLTGLRSRIENAKLLERSESK
jgi:hypothetical protein